MKFYSITALFTALFCTVLSGQDIEVKETLEVSTEWTSDCDLHLTSANTPLKEGVTVDLKSADSWLFFDQMKPKQVLKKYGNSILINGEVLDPQVNGRVGMYKQGTVIMPHAAGFQPLTTFTASHFEGSSARYTMNKYYSNAPGDSVPAAMRMPLEQDNQIRSFTLKRGYMATLANNPDGMGYSRVFIADEKDLEVADLPAQLNGKVSFIRVFKWEYASKKGWAGSVWKEQVAGLKYVEEQCDITNSTWYYNWSSTTNWTTNPTSTEPDYGVEFIPEKWGAGGTWGETFGVKDASHLMGYNEPDHTEQSNVSVAKAIEEWPMLMQTGMRLGSPATTDFTWLYNFMDECRSRNYRVDYVVMHAYWGATSPDQWYRRMKEVHERTGRPIWIKEWNNGANWTNESWPSGTVAQQAKQLRDLQGILEVMDTTSWIERYSIYNWVENKRMMLLSTGVLTPAGEFYAKNTPDLAFCREHEVIPEWTVREQPVLAYQGYDQEQGYAFSIRDYNGELIDSFVVERAVVPEGGALSDQDYQLMVTLPGSATGYTGAPVEGSGNVAYRVRAVAFNGKEKVSNVLSYRIKDNAEALPVVGEMPVNTGWSLLTVQNPYVKVPVTVLGANSFVNKSPLTNRIRRVTENSFELKLAAYDYLENPVYTIPDTVAYLALPEGRYDWGGLAVQAATVQEVRQGWKSVQFATPFEVLPVVFATQVTDNLFSATVARVRNVTKAGFEVVLQYEAGVGPNQVAEAVSYVAITPGQGMLGDRAVEVGRTPEATVGDERYGLYRIEYAKSYKNSLFFGAMQTVSDPYTATLRRRKRTDAHVEVLKDYDKSNGAQTVEKETVGWMVLGDYSYDTGVKTVLSNQQDVFYEAASDRLTFSGCSDTTLIEVFSLTGIKQLEQTGADSLSLAELSPGGYVVRINETTARKLIKR